MATFFQSLGVESHIQQEAMILLSRTARGFMRPDLFRVRLIKALARKGYSAIHLSRINAEIEDLVEHHLLVRRVKRGAHEVGLNKTVWRLTPETINAIREATIFVTSGCLFADKFCNVVENVKIQLRKMKLSRIRVSDAVFEILVSRFSSRHLD